MQTQLGAPWWVLAWLIVGGLGALAASQTIYVWRYAIGCRRRLNESDGPDDHAPRAAVIVCLRGLDPSVPASLEAIGIQDYPNFEIHLVLDSSTDPAIRVAREFCQQSRNPAATHVLPSPSGKCGVKCDLQRLAYSRISDSTEVIVFVDADGVTSRNWLRTLIAPLASREIGAVSGNRWYAAAPGWGSQVRRLWNAAAIVQMYLYRIPWGGSLAIRRDAVEQAKLINVWKTTFCEDTVIARELARHNWSVRYLPDVVVINRERASLRDAIAWITRQLLTVRLYHWAWPCVAVHAAWVAISVIGSGVFVLLAAALGHFWPSVIGAVALLLFQVVNLKLLSWIERATVVRSSEIVWTKSFGNPMVAVLLTSLTQLVHCLAAIRAAIVSQVSWRTIRYRVSKKSVEVLEYHPYQQLGDSAHSIF